MTTRQPRATSNYRQMRLTATLEPGGRASYSLYAKGLRDQWNEHTCLVRSSIDVNPRTLQSTEDVVTLMVEVLSELFLPPVTE